MYVCLCQAVKESEVRRAIAAGAEDVEALGEKLGVGTGCGCCLEYAQALVDEHGGWPSTAAALSQAG